MIEGYYILPNGSMFSCKSKRFLKPDINELGYSRYTYYVKGKRIRKFAHRLVYEHYCEDIKDNLVINHIDGNPLNNHISNLEAVSQQYNVEHSIVNRRRNFTKGVKCFKKETGEFYKSFKGIREAALYVGIASSGIDRVLAGKGKTAGGFTWQYADLDIDYNGRYR